MGAQLGEVAAANAVFLLGEHDDRSPFRRFVGERRELRSVGKLLFAYAAHRLELGRLPVAEGDGAGLVEQQCIDVPGGLDRAARHRQHVEADKTVHTGDADRRQQRADGGRDQGHEQRHQDNHRDGTAGIGHVARDRRRREHEDNGQADQQDVERDLVRRLLTLGTLDQLDHAVDEGRTRRRGNAHLDPVRQHLGAAGHGRTVAAGLADDGRRFAGDRRLVHRGDAFHHLAVRRNGVAGLDHDDIADLETCAWHASEIAAIGADQKLRLRFGARAPQRIRLRLTAALRDRFREVGEQHREPQPQHDLEFETKVRTSGHDVADQYDGRQRGDHLEHEHNRILHQASRIELDEGRADRRSHDLGVEQRRDRHLFAHMRGIHRRGSDV